MADKDILQRVIEVFATMTETADEITADSQLIEDLEISSMDVLYLISSLEEEFKIKVSEKAIRRMATIGDVAEIITELTGK
jgi:acyl carrier protein